MESELSRRLLTEHARYMAHHYEPPSVALDFARGSRVFDVDGREYIDMLACYSASSFGHTNPRLIAAVVRQMAKLGPVSNVVCNETTVAFCRELAELTRIKDAMVLPMNGGAEAVEKAIKIARKWGYEIKGKGKDIDEAEIIVSLTNFHGRTFGVLSASFVAEYKENFGPFLDGFEPVDFGDVNDLREAINSNTVAVLLEPIQGEGGFIFPPEGYLQKVREICIENNILLIFDEIPTAFGRTGKDFPHEHYGIMPDMLVLGKALGGGVYPVSAVVASQEIMSVLRPHDDGSTFGGNPIACAVGLEAMQILKDENLAERSRELGEKFLKSLQGIKSRLVKEVRGLGLFIGMELDSQQVRAEDFCAELLKRGVLTAPARKNVVRFTPPLTISETELITVVGAVSNTIDYFDDGYYNRLPKQLVY